MAAVFGKIAGVIGKNSDKLASFAKTATDTVSKHGSEIASTIGKTASASKDAITKAASEVSSSVAKVGEKAGELYKENEGTISQMSQMISSTQGAKQGSSSTESNDKQVQSVGSQWGDSIKGVYGSIFPSKLDLTSASKAAGEALIQRICDAIAKDPGIVKLIENSLKHYLTDGENNLAGKKLNQAMYHIIDKFLEHLLVDDYAEQKLVSILLEENGEAFRKIFTTAMVYNTDAEKNKPKVTSTNSRKISHQIVENVKKLLKKTNGQRGGNNPDMNKQIINMLDYNFSPNTDTNVTNSEILKTILESLKRHMDSPEFGQKVQPIIIDAISRLFKTFVTSIGGFDLAKYIMWGILQNSHSVRNICFNAVDKVVQRVMVENSPNLTSNHANEVVNGFLASLNETILYNESSLVVTTGPSSATGPLSTSSSASSASTVPSSSLAPLSASSELLSSTSQGTLSSSPSTSSRGGSRKIKKTNRRKTNKN